MFDSAFYQTEVLDPLAFLRKCRYCTVLYCANKLLEISCHYISKRLIGHSNAFYSLGYRIHEKNMESYPMLYEHKNLDLCKCSFFKRADNYI